jgi:parvulin-like peptidyl-prolyl isomerase
MRHIIVACAVAGLILLCAASLQSQQEKPEPRSYIDGIEVVVNEERITQSEINAELHRIILSKQGQQIDEIKLINTVIHMLIRERLLAQLAEREKIQIDEKRLDEIIEQRVREYGGEGELIQAVFPLRILTDKGLTLGDVRNFFIRQQKIHAVVEQKTYVPSVFVTPDKIKQYYAAHKEQWKLPATVKFREIQVVFTKNKDAGIPNFKEFATKEDAKASAEELLKRIKGGEDFAEIARKESNSPWYGEGGLHKTADGGERLKKEDVLQLMADFLFAEGRKNGDVSEVLQMKEKEDGETSYFILKVEDFQPERTLTFREAQEFIKARIVAEEQNRRLEELVRQLYKDAYIYPEEYRQPWTESSSQ